MERWRQDPRLRYYAASLLIALVTNRILFPLGHALGQLFPHRDLSLPSEPLLPFLPWTIVIYVGVFAWWGYVFYLVSQRDRREGDRLFAADLLAKLVCLAFFVFLPTSVTRPAVTGGSLWEAAVRLLYRADTPDNLFPSVHCLLGWLCYIALRGRRDVPILLRTASLLLAAAVCVSTLTLRQHVLCDVIGGIALAEIAYALCARPVLRGVYGRLADGLAVILFGKQEG